MTLFSSPRRILLLAFVVAATARLAVLFLFNMELSYGDEQRFWSRATNLVGHFSFRGMGGGLGSDMPLPSLFFALIHLLGGGVAAAKIATCFVGALAVVPVGLLARRLTDNSLAMGLAALFAALYPAHVYFSSLLLSEPFFFTLLPWFFLSLMSAADKMHATRAGFVAGLVHLTRPTLVYFFPVSMAWAWFARGWTVRRMAQFALILSLLVTPWVIRNWIVYDTFIATTTGSGQVLWEGNNPWNTTGGVSQPHWKYLEGIPYDRTDLARNDLIKDAWKKEKAVRFIKENPGRFLKMSLKKFVRFWNVWPSTGSITSLKVRLVSALSFSPILLLALASLWVLRDRFRDTSLLWLFTGYYTALHMATIGSIRYRLPLDTLLMALAAACLARLIVRKTVKD